MMGVVSAAMRFGGLNFVNDTWVESAGAQWVALAAYLLLIVYLVWDAMRAKTAPES